MAERKTYIESTQLVQKSNKTEATSASEETPASKCVECCHIDVRLVKFKAQFFFFYGALGSILPFMSVYLKQLGMNALQIGILFGIKPFFGFVASPIWGIIADRFKLRKFILLMSITAWIVTFLIIGHLTPARLADKCPPQLQVVNHTHTNITESLLDPDVIYEYKSSFNWMFNTADVNELFIVIMICIIIGECFWSPIGALSDVGIMSHLGEEESHKYSLQRSFGALGMGLFQLLTGVALNTTVTERFTCGLHFDFPNYRVAFYIFGAAMIVTFIISSTFKFSYDDQNVHDKALYDLAGDSVQTHEPSQPVRPVVERKYNVWKLARLLGSVHYASWLLCVAYMGFCNGIILGFLFWYLEALGGDNLLMGITGGLASGSEFVFFFIAPQFVRKVGKINTLYIALLMYAVRFINYGFMVNPWLVLPSEVLQGFTFATGWAALVEHVWDGVPERSFSSIMGLLHGVYWGLGIGSGHVIGGILIDTIGAKAMFQLLIGVSIAMAGLLWIAQTFSVQPIYNDTDEEDLIK